MGNKKPKALFVGRWQPLHLGHEFLFYQKLNEGIPVLIAVRDMEPDANNPFTAEESARIIRKRFEGEEVEVMIIPDVESVCWGRGVGWKPTEFEVPSHISNISATGIRNQIKEGKEDWKNNVNPKIQEDIEIYLKERF